MRKHIVSSGGFYLKKRILITSALPYVNNIPHLGNIVGCVLSADVFARYCRSVGYETLFICGTDEYGTATEVKAMEEGLTPKEICDKYYHLHKKIYEWFGISTDVFGRTTTEIHKEITQSIFLDLYNNRYIVEEEIEQAYDEKAKIFLADRFIQGTCPYCNYEEARADQCENCGKLLTFNELLNPLSRLTKTKPKIVKSKHLFLNLPKIQKELSLWINEASENGKWSENSIKITKSWLAEGLKLRSITRDLKWGVPVPLPGWENKVFYVWFDAPIGYISITASYTDSWKEWWLNPKEVSLYQFMGKDNVPFHTILFPATLIGTGKKWTLLENISTTEYLNFEGGKFSKSRKIGVFGDDAMESGIPADAWRYYLLTNRPEKTDTNFTWQDFREKLNNELLANIGNLVYRTLVFLDKEFNGVVPSPALIEKDILFIKTQTAKLFEAGKLIEDLRLRDALHLIMHCGKEANAYFQYSEPWKIIKEDQTRCATVLFVLLHQVKDLAIALQPFIPHTSKSIFEQLGIPMESWKNIGQHTISPGHRLNKPKILFKKLDEADIKRLEEKYSKKTQKDEIRSDSPSFEEACKLDLEVGKIISARFHPNANRLYILNVLLSDGERQIVSGIVPFYKLDELIGKNIVILKNLKKATIRGVESFGMLLAAQKDNQLEILSPSNANPGDKIEIEGINKKDADINSGEVDIEGFAKINMEVLDYIAYINGKKMCISGIPLKTSKIKEGKIK